MLILPQNEAKKWRFSRDFWLKTWRIWRYFGVKLAISDKKLLATLHKTVLQEDISGGNTNLFKKSPWYFSLQKKPKWVPLNGANGWELRAQWNILSKYYDILAKYLTVLSNLSCQHHSAVTQFGLFWNTDQMWDF